MHVHCLVTTPRPCKACQMPLPGPLRLWMHMPTQYCTAGLSQTWLLIMSRIYSLTSDKAALKKFPFFNGPSRHLAVMCRLAALIVSFERWA